MSEWTFVGAAYAVTWLVFGLYHVKLSRDSRRVRSRGGSSTPT